MRTTIRKVTESVDDSIPLSEMEVGVRYVLTAGSSSSAWEVGDFVFADVYGECWNPRVGNRSAELFTYRVRRIPDDEVVEIHA